MQFKEYSNINQLKHIKEKLDQDVDLLKAQWVVTEKVHGTNLSIWTDGKTECRVAKRSSFLTEEDAHKFYGATRIRDELAPVVKAMCHELKAETLALYGEWFGGFYGKYEVKPDEDDALVSSEFTKRHKQAQAPGGKKKEKHVQKGVMYSPYLHFYAFDIRINNQDHMLPYEHTLTLFRKHNLLHATPLFKGTFEECWAYSSQTYDQLTLVPALLGVPPLQEKKVAENNIREGNIIRPLNYVDDNRVIKHKNSKFVEDTTPTSKKQTGPESDEKKQNSDVHSNVQKWVALISPKICNARLDNVLSKEAPDFISTHTERVCVLLVQDAIHEFIKDLASPELALLQTEWEALHSALQKPLKKRLDSVLARMAHQLVQTVKTQK